MADERTLQMRMAICRSEYLADRQNLASAGSPNADFAALPEGDHVVYNKPVRTHVLNSLACAQLEQVRMGRDICDDANAGDLERSGQCGLVRLEHTQPTLAG